MLTVTLSHVITSDDLEPLKAAASQWMRAVRQPTHRLEILARAVGCDSWAALQASARAATPDRRSVQLEPALAYAAERGIRVAPIAIHAALAVMTEQRIARLTPELQSHGWGPESCRPWNSEQDEIRSRVAPHEFGRAVLAVRDEKFSQQRREMLEANQPSQFLRAMAMFGLLEPTKSAAANSRGSYTLKHLAESLAFDLGHGIILGPRYVTNSDVIAAAIDQGFPVRHADSSSPNVMIGISRRSLRMLEGQRQASAEYREPFGADLVQELLS